MKGKHERNAVRTPAGAGAGRPGRARAAAVFLGYLALFFILRLLTPAREFSGRENRVLTQRPAFTAAALFSGDFTSRFESYLTDQFPLRDLWIPLKARCELLSGKRENNGVYYCAGGTLLARYDAPEEDELLERVSYVNLLAEHADCPVYFALIPGAVEVQRELLPANAPGGSQAAVIGAAYDACTARTVDLLTPLESHKDEYIFYRTDHHWTTLGAFYGFGALRQALGLGEAPALPAYEPVTVAEDFLGTACSSSGFTWVEPDIIQTFVPAPAGMTITNYNRGEGAQAPLYDESRLEGVDKYSYFLGGNTPRLTVETENTAGPRLLILRDSYTDCLLPFLLEDCSRIDLIDLRYFKDSLQDYIRSEGFDAVLVLYSAANFSTDENLFLLSY